MIRLTFGLISNSFFGPLLIQFMTLIFSITFIGDKNLYQEFEDQSTLTIKNRLCFGNTILDENFKAVFQPKIREKIGDSHFKITTNNKLVQLWFDNGINLLHDFWYFESYRAFSKIIELEPSNPMGYWGLAMSQPSQASDDNSLWVKSIEKAKLLSSGCSAIERDLISASYFLIKGEVTDAQNEFRRLIYLYPDNPEIIALSSIILRQFVDSQDKSDELKSILEKALIKYPNHTGLLHTYLHVMEVRKDYFSAKNIYNRIADTAPNASHIVHMPGHFFFLEGQYQRAVHTFERAKKIDDDYHSSEKIPIEINQNYLHNLHFLALCYSELNLKDKAMASAQQYSNITLRQKNTTNTTHLMLLYEGRILPALVHIRFREYKDAAEKLSIWLNNQDFRINNQMIESYLKAMRSYCEGMNYIQLNDENSAIQASVKMKKEMDNFVKQGVTLQNTIEYKFINETFDILQMAYYELIGWGVNMKTDNEFIDEPWNEALKLEKLIKYDEPPRLMYPISESKARLHRLRGEKKLLEEAKSDAFQIRKNSVIISNI